MSGQPVDQAARPVKVAAYGDETVERKERMSTAQPGAPYPLRLAGAITSESEIAKVCVGTPPRRIKHDVLQAGHHSIETTGGGSKAAAGGERKGPSPDGRNPQGFGAFCAQGLACRFSGGFAMRIIV